MEPKTIRIELTRGRSCNHTGTITIERGNVEISRSLQKNLSFEKEREISENCKRAYELIYGSVKNL